MCLTRNRRQWLKNAIRSYLGQTYPASRRELLIVADGEDVHDLLPVAENVRLIHLAEQTTVGQKRNFACSRARGEVIAHWDDDDWSEPGRLEDQVEMLVGHTQVAGYCSMRFTDGVEWHDYFGPISYALGTSLCYWRSWWEAHPFEPINVGEDNHFVNAAQNAGVLASVPARGLMYATTHAGNTSPRIYGSNWKRIENL
jgi:glycosyltransferase involved in cell wall biosynthesis